MSGKVDISREIWKWVHLELWFKIYRLMLLTFINTNHRMTYQRCKIGLWDTSIPGIAFDEEGISNFCKMQQSLMKLYPRGEKGLNDWAAIVEKMKVDGKGKKYDCIIGISGGTDSSYLLHIAHECGLRVLAVYLDNGWGSNIAVTNIQKMTSALNFDLETFVINYEDVKVVFRSYILAGLPGSIVQPTRQLNLYCTKRLKKKG